MTSPLDVVREHEAAARARLMASSGGAALCRLPGGRSEVKVHEGAAAALAEARRRLLDLGAEAALAAVRGLEDQWRALADRADRRGPAWSDYATGGVEALSTLASALASSTSIRD